MKYNVSIDKIITYEVSVIEAESGKKAIEKYTNKVMAGKIKQVNIEYDANYIKEITGLQNDRNQ